MSDPSSPAGRERYLKHAKQAEDLAKRSQTEEERRAFEDIARLWRQLAERRG